LAIPCVTIVDGHHTDWALTFFAWCGGYRGRPQQPRPGTACSWMGSSQGLGANCYRPAVRLAVFVFSCSTACLFFLHRPPLNPHLLTSSGVARASSSSRFSTSWLPVTKAACASSRSTRSRNQSWRRRLPSVACRRCASCGTGRSSTGWRGRSRRTSLPRSLTRSCWIRLRPKRRAFAAVGLWGGWGGGMQAGVPLWVGSSRSECARVVGVACRIRSAGTSLCVFCWQGVGDEGEWLFPSPSLFRRAPKQRWLTTLFRPSCQPSCCGPWYSWPMRTPYAVCTVCAHVIPGHCSSPSSVYRYRPKLCH